MGMSWAILETLYPHYPEPKFRPRSFGQYMIATAMDIPEIDHRDGGVPLHGGPLWGQRHRGDDR